MNKSIKFVLLGMLTLSNSVFAQWSAPGKNFSGELNIGGEVTSNRNPWVWSISQGTNNIDISGKPSIVRNGDNIWNVPLPGSSLLLGKTVLTTPTGRDGLAPKVSIGQGGANLSLVWREDGEGVMLLPVRGNGEQPVGALSLRIKAAALLRHVADGRTLYEGVYNNLDGNGLPSREQMMSPTQTMMALCNMFAGEGPEWICDKDVRPTDVGGLTRYSDSNLRQVEGAYGIQVVAGSGELRLDAKKLPNRWHVSLPIKIEYQ